MVVRSPCTFVSLDCAWGSSSRPQTSTQDNQEINRISVEVKSGTLFWGFVKRAVEKFTMVFVWGQLYFLYFFHFLWRRCSSWCTIHVRMCDHQNVLLNCSTKWVFVEQLSPLTFNSSPLRENACYEKVLIRPSFSCLTVVKYIYSEYIYLSTILRCKAEVLVH